jgi:hypothetical protein
MNRKILLVSVAALALAVTVAAYFKGRQNFDPDVWKEWSVAKHNYVAKNPRGRMVDDLLKHHLPLGLKRSDAVAMLGKPDDEDGTSLRFYLGGDSGGALLAGYDYLLLTFDADGKLLTKRIQKSG